VVIDNNQKLFDKLCRLKQMSHRRGEVVIDSPVQENGEESFLPTKVIAKYLFDNIYVVQFKLDESSKSSVSVNLLQAPVIN